MKTPAWNIQRVNPKKISPFILTPFYRTGRNTLYGFQIDKEQLILFFNKNSDPPDEIPESLHRYKRENIIIVQIDVPSKSSILEMVRVFTCKEP